MYYTGKKLYYILQVTPILDGVYLTGLTKTFNLLSGFTATGTIYTNITINELSYYTDTEYNTRYSGFIKYINDTFFTGFEFTEIVNGISGDTSCIPTTIYSPTTTIYSPTTTIPIPPTTVYVPTTINNSCVQISDQLGWSNVSGNDACGQLKDTYFGNNTNFALTTRISANNSCTVTLGGYYSNGSIWKYTLDGNNFISGGTCGSPTTTTTLSPSLGKCYNISIPSIELNNGGTLYIEYYPYGGLFTSLPYYTYDDQSIDPNYLITNLCSTQPIAFRRTGVVIYIPSIIITEGLSCTDNDQCGI